MALGFVAYMCMTRDTGPVNDGLRAEARLSPVLGATHPKRVNLATTPGPDMRGGSRVQLMSPEARLDFTFRALDTQVEPLSARSSFGERFSFDQAAAPTPSLQRSLASASFDDRFGGDGSAQDATVRSAAAPPRAAAPRAAAAVVLPRPAPRSVVARTTPKQAPEARFQLASASDNSLPLGYAPSDSVTGSAMTGSSVKDVRPRDSGSVADADMRHTAIYDITSHTVYLPNGQRLEAHSGVGSYMDDPRYVDQRMTGPTPPNLYELKLRESLFHGVRAIRLIPTDHSTMHGRSGILAHSYLLGPNGQSNGCVSFSDYSAFLDAYLRGDVKRLVVVEHLADAPFPRTASDWLSNALKDIFGRS
jgi:hypothetical protein